MEGPDFLRPTEAARRLGISSKTVLRMLKERQLPGVKIGRQWRVPRARFEEWIHGLEGERSALVSTSKPVAPE